MTFVFVELLKFHSTNKVFNKMAELWLAFLTCREGLKPEDAMPSYLDANEATKAAVGYLEESSFSMAEKYAYDKYWDGVSCERTLLSETETRAKEEGRQEGIREGIEQERQRAMEEKARSVKALKALGISDKDIAASMGMSEEEVAEVCKE